MAKVEIYTTPFCPYCDRAKALLRNPNTKRLVLTENAAIRIGEAIRKAGADVALLTAPASIAWLFNIRGGDVIRTPLPLAQAILEAYGRARLFLDPAKVTRSALQAAASIGGLMITTEAMVCACACTAVIPKRMPIARKIPRDRVPVITASGAAGAHASELWPTLASEAFIFR